MIQDGDSAVSGKGTSVGFETSRSGRTGFFLCRELLCRGSLFSGGGDWLVPVCAGRGEAVKANSKGGRFYPTGSSRGNHLLLLKDLSNRWKLKPVPYFLCNETQLFL